MTADTLNSTSAQGRLRGWAWWIALLVSVTLLWCAAYNRWTADAWGTPIAYDGDAAAVMGIAKTFATGEVKPLLPKYPASLGAPFVADWNDYPPAEGLFTWYGLIARLFGIFAGSNLIVLSAHLLAASAFYFVGKKLNYRPIFAFAGAILFSFSHFAFARHLAHLGPLFYWHVPLGLLIAYWCAQPSAILQDRRKIALCIFVAIAHGMQDPYYSGLFLQFLVLASAVCLMRRQSWRRVLFPLSIAFLVLGTHVVVNIDLFYGKFTNGPNPEAFVRNYAGLELYAMKPFELLLPFPHRIPGLYDWVHKAYFTRAYFLGEIGSPYLGLVGIASLCVLLWLTFRAVSGRDHSIPVHFWGVLWILAYSVVGGLNGLIGVFGIIVFRGTNRYSIVLLAIFLLFLVRQLSMLTRKWNRFAVLALAASITVIGFLDQTPRPPRPSDIASLHKKVVSDGRIAAMLEAALPGRAMIFQMPVSAFPEFGPIGQMPDYDHFRPYLQSHSLRFSYGSVKGRTRERWQSEALQFGTAQTVAILESAGFSAILINKQGYEAKAAALLAELSAAGRSEVICDSDDLIAIRLRPVPHPLLPPEFDRHWSALEGNVINNWRWSHGNADLVLYNDETKPQDFYLTFSLSTVRARDIEISTEKEDLYRGVLAENRSPELIKLTVTAPPGRTMVHFRTNTQAELPGNGDTRKVAFCLWNFVIRNTQKDSKESVYE